MRIRARGQVAPGSILVAALLLATTAGAAVAIRLDEEAPQAQAQEVKCAQFPGPPATPPPYTGFATYCAQALAYPQPKITKGDRTITCRAEAGYNAHHYEQTVAVFPPEGGFPKYLPDETARGAKLTWTVWGTATGSCADTKTISGTSYRPAGTTSGPAVEDTLLVATETFQCTATMEVTVKVNVTATTEFGVQHMPLRPPLQLPDGSSITHIDTPALGSVTVSDEHEDTRGPVFCEGSS